MWRREGPGEQRKTWGVSLFLTKVPAGKSSHLIDVGEVAQVEVVVELDGRGQEGGGHAVVQKEARFHQVFEHMRLLHVGREFARMQQMLLQNARVDGVQSVLTGEGHGQDAEMPLQEENDLEAKEIKEIGVHANRRCSSLLESAEFSM